MRVEVRLNEQSIEVINDAPTSLRSYIIPGSDTLFASNDCGQFLLQVINLEKFSIVFAVLQTKKDVLFAISSTEDLILSHMALKGNFKYSINEKIIDISEGKYNVYFTSKLNTTLALSGNNEYMPLFLVYSNDFIQQQLAYFPSIEDLKSLIEKKITAISSSPTYMSAKMFDFVHTLLHSPYSEATYRFHFDIGKHLLKLMLQEVTRAGHTESKYSLEYLERIHAAKNYIDSNLLRHDTIHQIARKVCLNELKLKTGFKEVFGKGLYGYRKQERLKIAKAALQQTTKPIKEISKNAGYKSSNNFSIAFKKSFGISPAQLRKKYRA